MSTVSEVMGSMNDANQNLEDIQSQLFVVEDRAKVAPVDGWEIPEGKEVYTQEGIWLGSVGNQYESLQPQAFFDSVVDNVRDSGMELDLSKLTYKSRLNNKIIEFRLPTKIISFKNAVGKQDETQMFLNFETGFAGKAKTEVGLYSKRFICSNGMRIINADIDLKVKHTINMNVKALTFAKELIKTASTVEATSQVWSEMNNVQVNAATLEQFVRNMAKVKKGELYSDLSTRKKNIYDTIQESVAIEFGRTGSTVWGLLNGATFYSNHMAAGSGDEEYILSKTGAKDITLAQELVLELI